jgi:predicted ATPase
MRRRPPRSVSAAGAPRTNIRDVASSFVGRAADIAGVARLFEEGARLVTVTGPGGMGKTRVAVRYAETQVAACSAHGGGGAWFCDLTEARRRGEIVARVAAAIGAERAERAGEASAGEDLGEAMARRGRMLVALDNFEHLVAEASLVEAWTRAAPLTRFLVTSRVALDLPGEARWPLDALPRAEAVALLLGRARQVRPGLVLAAADEEALGEIVERLDGMPLALELAASRLRVLSPRELRDRLRRPLDLLVRRGDEGRHASVRRAILDSVQALSAAERATFAACAVFHGGFRVDAAEAVIGDVLAELDALARASLIRAVPDADGDGETRLSFFETIREVAAEIFAADPARAEIERRHTAHYAELARRLGEAAAVSSGDAHLRLARELSNLLEAHRRAVAGGDADRALTLALGLDPHLAVRGQSSLRRRLFDEALARAPEAEPRRCEALLARAAAQRELDGGRGFRLPGAPAVVDLSRRAPLRRILERLAQSRRAEPGEAVAVDEILAAGWPGEKIQAEAALNRLHVALATLRKLGLREVLITADGGYMLDPAVPLAAAQGM